MHVNTISNNTIGTHMYLLSAALLEGMQGSVGLLEEMAYERPHLEQTHYCVWVGR